MRFRGVWWLIASALVVAGCGGSSTTTTPQTAPAVSSVTPANGNTGVAVSATVTATFNEVMNATTLNSSTFTLKSAGGIAVTGNVSYSAGSSTAVFTPASPLAFNTAYTATITTGAQNPAGTALGANDTWSFTTATGPAPTVTAVTPGNGSTGVVAATTVTATFSEAMNASTITASTFTLTPQGGAPVSATVSYNAATVTATLTPNAPLTAYTTYTAAVTTGVVAATGSALADVNSWSFTTAQGPVPTVTAVTPTSGTTGVTIASTVAATFSEAMDPLTVTGSTFTLTAQGGASVTGTVAPDPTNTIFTFTPSAPLAYNTTYTALITTGVQAASQVPEVPLAANYTWSFTTAVPPPAAIIAVTPASGSTGIAITGTPVTATFGAAMTPSTINPSTFTLTGPSGVVAGAVAYNSTTFIATLTPSVSFANGATYTATIGTGATSSLGGPLPAPYTWSFTAVAANVPTVTSVTPASGATNVNVASAVTATFSGPMNAATLTTSTFTLSPATTGTVAYNSGTQTATFTPSASLAPSTAYTATITTGAQGSTGAALASSYTWTFTTGASPSAVAVSYGTTYQTIRGFGGAEAWQPVMSAAQINALYGTGAGQVGLTIMRLRIDPSSTTGGANWNTELANGLAAQKLGAIVFATPWTPPAAWKSNGSLNEGSLNAANYADFANYLETYVNYATSQGVNLYAISMQNEPDWNPCGSDGGGGTGSSCYESCLWTGAQMDTWVAQNASVLTTKLIMPESYYFNKAMSDPTLSDPNAAGQVAIVGGHLYGSTPYYYTLAESLGKDVWMTEHAMTLVGSTQSITDAMNEALELHNSMTVGQYNAYVYWWMVNTSASSPHLINTDNTPTFIGSAVGQFSLFVRPGYIRASATANPVAGVYVSAYTGMVSGTQHYVIVAINNNSTVRNINFTVSDAPTKISSMTPTQTTSAAELAPQSAVTVMGGQFYYTMPAQSIVTFVQ